MNAAYSLEEADWTGLQTAYGAADKIPTFLRGLAKDPTCKNEVWDELWSYVCHQGTVYTASYATVPHVVRIAESTLPESAEMCWQFFGLPMSIELGRLSDDGSAVPADLEKPYFAALQGLHRLAFELAAKPWNEDLAVSIAGALLVSKGHTFYPWLMGLYGEEDIRHALNLLDSE